MAAVELLDDLLGSDLLVLLADFVPWWRGGDGHGFDLRRAAREDKGNPVSGFSPSSLAPPSNPLFKNPHENWR